MTIDQNIIEILASSRVQGNQLFLEGQLDRKTYLEVNKILESIGGTWNKKLKCHVFTDDVEEVLSEIINTGEFKPAKDKKKLLNFFPTPQKLAARLVELAEIGPEDSVLETSAGKGALIKEIEKKTQDIVYFEIDKENFGFCQNNFSATGLHLDFLESGKITKDFTRIIQNPPFHVKGHAQMDVSFVLHAFYHLKIGGILVSIVSESPFFRTNKKSIEFRQWLKDNNAEIIDLDRGAFKESGTMVKTRIIKVIKS